MHSSLGNLFLKVVVSGKNALLTLYWLATFFLKFKLWPVFEYQKVSVTRFLKIPFKTFSFNIYSLLFIQCISLHIFCKSWGTWSGDFWLENTKGEDMGEAIQVQATILITTRRRQVFLDIGVPRKQAKSLKNISEGVNI